MANVPHINNTLTKNDFLALTLLCSLNSNI